MAAEDRRLRLAGYEVYRFGGAELTNEERGKALLETFSPVCSTTHPRVCES